MITQSLQQQLKDFSPITLDEMNAVRLMDRIDTKYIIPATALPEFLSRLQYGFRVQTIGAKQIAGYETRYFDTPAADLFRMHQCGKLCRQKIRIRTYADTQNAFLEIKNKNNKGRTQKTRTVCLAEPASGLKPYLPFLDGRTLYPCKQLEPLLQNRFSRITLINNQKTERLTIDLDLAFYNERSNQRADLSQLVVIELKQQGSAQSLAAEVLKADRIRACGFSKYCIGCALTDPDIAANRLKKKIRYIHKLSNTR